MNDLDRLADDIAAALTPIHEEIKRTNELLEKLIEIQAIDTGSKIKTGSLFESIFGDFVKEAVEQETPEPGKEDEPLERAKFLDWRENETNDGYEITNDGVHWEPANPVQVRDINDMINARPRGRGRSRGRIR